MKKALLGLILFFSINAFAAGGDIGGGGNLQELRKAFKLPPEVVEELRNQGDELKAFKHWVQTLSPEERNRLYEKVFQFHILPQL